MKRNLQSDLKLLADAFYDNLCYDDSCEYGSIGVDCKRPFGNSFVCGDILEIIGWEDESKDDDEYYTEEQREYANILYKEKLVPYLKKQWKK